MTPRALSLPIDARQWTPGAHVPGLIASSKSSIAVLRTSRGALIVEPGEWVCRLGDAEPFVLTAAQFARSFEAECSPPASPSPCAQQRPRARATPPRATTAPITDTRPRSTLESHRASAEYTPDLEMP